jgi:tRNA A-37 threonylcarbamoyl transferase component Bud32
MEIGLLVRQTVVHRKEWQAVVKDRRGALLAKLRLSLQQLAGDRGKTVKFHGNTNDRLLVELDRKPYLLLVPNTTVVMTAGSVRKRINSWPGLAGREAAGHVVLAPNASLSPTLPDSSVKTLPAGTVVVGRWGSGNEVAAHGINPDLGLILEAAGVPYQRLVANDSGLEPSPLGLQSLQGAIPSPSQRSLRPGTRIDNYRVDRRLGRGHSAEVWKAEVVAPIAGVDLAVGTSVALKVYFPSLLQGFQTLRIQREFSVASSLNHPSLARVYDLLLAPSRPFHSFMAMEFIDGPTLKAVIETQGKLAPIPTLSVASQLFGALAEIHSEDALHRDVKAANIMVSEWDDRTPTIKLVDLGIVSIPTEDQLTAASVFLGSKHSAPLEQLTGRNVDERTDIYAAGSVLFHCLKGSPMYQSAGPEGAIVQQMMATPETLPIDHGKSQLESELFAFVNRCVSVAPRSRPRTAMECVQEVGRIQARYS